MKLLIDDANINKIKDTCLYYPIDGVTTNPTILSKQEADPVRTLGDIRNIIGNNRQLHVQVLSRETKEIEKEADMIVSKFGSNTYIKIPSVKEGFLAMQKLSRKGINITATAIYTPLQAFIAAKSGASYVAPYVNRIDNLGYDGVAVTLEILDMLRNNKFNTGVLAASFKNNNQILKLINKGVDAITCSSDTINKFVSDKNVNYAIDNFIEDFSDKVKGNKSFIDLLD